MLKDDMAVKLVEKFGWSKKDAKEYISTILDMCMEGAMEDGLVRIDTHRFKKVERAARLGHNPKTGEKINIPAKTIVQYRNTRM